MTGGADRKHKSLSGGGMTIADSLLKQLGPLSSWQRDELYLKIASDYGEGFARVMRAEFEKRDRETSK
jgi:hypothetical protein